MDKADINNGGNYQIDGFTFQRVTGTERRAPGLPKKKGTADQYNYTIVNKEIGGVIFPVKVYQSNTAKYNMVGGESAISSLLAELRDRYTEYEQIEEELDSFGTDVFDGESEADVE